MKTLSIQQPWASLICAGIKDVENRTWKPAEAPGRILIHASSKNVPVNFLNTVPLDWMISIVQDQVFGNIQGFAEMPTSAIIGYVTVKSFSDETESFWDGGPGQIKWELEDAYIFDKPIENIKGKLNLFDYPMDEDNLPPAHKVQLRYPSLDSETLTVPVAPVVIDSIEAGVDCFEVDLDATLADTLADNEGCLKPFTKVRFEDGSRILECEAVDPVFMDHLCPDNQQPVVEKNIRGEDVPWQFLSVLLKKVE